MVDLYRRGGVIRSRWLPRRGPPTLGRIVMIWSIGSLLVGQPEVEAQSRRPVAGLQVTPMDDLRFGTVVPGVTTSVPPGRQQQSGLFGITGQQDMSVRVDLLLPTAMRSSAGDQFPILFSRADGSASSNRGRGQAQMFDPHQPLVTTLGRNGRLYIRLGGTVVPDRFQPGGVYGATVTLTVANLGN